MGVGVSTQTDTGERVRARGRRPDLLLTVISDDVS